MLHIQSLNISHVNNATWLTEHTEKLSQKFSLNHVMQKLHAALCFHSQKTVLQSYFPLNNSLLLKGQQPVRQAELAKHTQLLWFGIPKSDFI